MTAPKRQRETHSALCLPEGVQPCAKPTAQRLSRRVARLLAIASMIATVAGCEGALTASTAGQLVTESSKASTLFDAGVVFADRENYLCIPFAQLGLADIEVPLSVDSSCECVHPSIVSYHTPQGRDARAVLLRFAKEDSQETPSTEPGTSSNSAVNLGVVIDMKLADGSDKQFTVNLLHTSLAEEIAP